MKKSNNFYYKKRVDSLMHTKESEFILIEQIPSIQIIQLEY